MQDAMVIEGAVCSAAPNMHGAQHIPLTFLRAGERAQVIKVRGKDDVRHHLENLGFVAGAPVSVVSEHGGDLIVEVKGAQIALDRTAAQKIIAA